MSSVPLPEKCEYLEGSGSCARLSCVLMEHLMSGGSSFYVSPSWVLRAPGPLSPRGWESREGVALTPRPSRRSC